MIKPYRPFQPTLTETGLKRFGLSLESSPACAALRSVVHSYLQISASEPTPYPVIPDGTQAIFISPHGSMIGGSQTQTHDIQILEPGSYFGIRFYPGALRHLFELNLSEVTDQMVDSHYFPCRLFRELHNGIYQQSLFRGRAQVCEQWVLQNLLPQANAQFDHALSLIYQSFGAIKVAQLATMVGWSSRHLNRMFRFHTGLSTKAFTQTIRIQHACKQLHLAPRNSLSSAYELGYFDQSHLIKDYKKHLLLNPSLFFDRFKSDFYNS